MKQRKQSPVKASIILITVVAVIASATACSSDAQSGSANISASSQSSSASAPSSSTTSQASSASSAAASNVDFYKEFFERYYSVGNNSSKISVPFNGQAQQFIAGHDDLFPTKTTAAKTKVNGMIDANLSYKNIAKNEDDCVGKVLSFSGTVSQIKEFQLTNDTATLMLVANDDQDVYEAVYKGKTDILEGDTVHVVATPDTIDTYPNTSGGTTQAAFTIAAYVEKAPATSSAS